jgi:hypothetical protein
MDLLGTACAGLWRSRLARLYVHRVSPLRPMEEIEQSRIFTGDRSGDWLFEALASLWICESSRLVDASRTTASHYSPIAISVPPYGAPLLTISRHLKNLKSLSSVLCEERVEACCEQMRGGRHTRQDRVRSLLESLSQIEGLPTALLRFRRSATGSSYRLPWNITADRLLSSQPAEHLHRETDQSPDVPIRCFATGATTELPKR